MYYTRYFLIAESTALRMLSKNDFSTESLTLLRGISMIIIAPIKLLVLVTLLVLSYVYDTVPCVVVTIILSLVIPIPAILSSSPSRFATPPNTNSYDSPSLSLLAKAPQ